MGTGFEPQPNHSTSKHPHFLRMLFFLYMCPDQNAMGPGFEPQPNHTQSFKSILKKEDAFLHLLVPRPKRNGSWVRAPAESQLSVLIREQGVETWLEASTERSESNPGRSLGIYRAYSDSCLEDSTSPRPSIRCQSDKSVFEKKLSSERTRIERIERMK